MTETNPSAEGSYRASFDLTSFESADTFKRLLDRFDLEANESYDGKGWEWANEDGLSLHTYNHPISGERAGLDRKKEPGYASYIHIEGPQDQVEDLFESIEDVATHIKESSLGEWVV